MEKTRNTERIVISWWGAADTWHPKAQRGGRRQMKPNSIYHHCPSGWRTAAERFVILFVSTPSFLKHCQDAFKPHPCSSCSFSLETPLISAKRGKISDYPVKGKGWRSFCRGLRGLVLPPPAPFRGLLGTVNTMREGHWLPRFGRAGREQHVNIWEALKKKPEGDAQGDDDGGVSVCVFGPSCVCFKEKDLIALFFESSEFEKRDLLRNTRELNDGSVGKSQQRWREIVKYSLHVYWRGGVWVPVWLFVHATCLKTGSFTWRQDVELRTLGNRAAPSEPRP